ncbi:MAG: acyltransferase [Proteobacteria bacterium]|nr:acyltransferase [Pseudomonadota bacterium]NOG60946.1 acyltransferase [Pseudomonadota bacterium]
MKVGFYQFRPIFGKTDQNCQKIVNALENVDADLIVLPELALSGYYFKDKQETLKYAEDPENSSRLDALCNLAYKRNLHLVIGFAEKQNDHCYNSAALIGPNGIEHLYRKVHLFNEEKFCFDPGDTPFVVNDINGVKIGIMICFDWVFPEVTRVLAMQGAQIICQPSNLVLTFCQQTMLARCIENRVFAITANRYGTDKRPQGSLKFTGKSQIVAPGGTLLHRAASQRDALYITEINPDDADNKMITEHNHLFNDRRREFYPL